MEAFVIFLRRKYEPISVEAGRGFFPTVCRELLMHPITPEEVNTAVRKGKE
jgi:hypothetical protein